MRLDNTFTVSFPPEQAWSVLTDLERIAPCMPGVHLDAVDGGDFTGGLRVKVGPITANYAGVARFVSSDAESRVVVWRAEGRELRGRGTASATVTMTLAPVPEGTRVELGTDLSISGRLAQFGRGVLGEVTGRLLGDFARELEREVSGARRPATEARTMPAGGPVPAPVSGPPAVVTDLSTEPWPDDETAAVPPPSPGPPPPQGTSAAAADAAVLRAVAIPIAKRAAPVLLAAVAFVLFARSLRRRQTWHT
ncbi:MAG: uncharacterized protein QOI21_2272 [Actinomycetota bacterium]|jgi:carbon monoxide dehydrogenase subunit G|nr:uncharacterized protein [Actinomycetota bacterium]